jgi:hypothetical protein
MSRESREGRGEMTVSDQSITIQHGGVEILYMETENKWRFELRGRERFAESLAKAREAIDKPEPKPKGKPFEGIKAYIEKGRWDKGPEFRVIEVTSIAETRYGRPEVWITDSGDRKKVHADTVFAITGDNDVLIADLKNLNVERARIGTKITNCRERLKPIALPKD